MSLIHASSNGAELLSPIGSFGSSSVAAPKACSDNHSHFQKAIKANKGIVFLGWEPHPMNVQMKMSYLAGGDDVFGPNLGEAKVYTAVTPSFETRCPNAAALIKNLQYSLTMENEVMGPILNKVAPNKAAKAYLQKNPASLDKWLMGVKTFDGKEGLAAVKASLK